MKEPGASITLKAAELDLVDLDEFQPCHALSMLILSHADVARVQALNLDLEHCWIEYSFSYLYLDAALNVLAKAAPQAPKLLRIIVSINLGEPHYMATLLFRLSKVLNSAAESDPSILLKNIANYCKKNVLEIRVESKLKRDGSDESCVTEFILGLPDEKQT